MPSHIQAYKYFTRQIKKESERFRDATKSPPKHPPLTIGGRLYKYRTHALRDLSITDEELAALVEWTDVNPTIHTSAKGKNIHKWSTFHYRTAWKHPNAGPKTFTALQKSVYWPARCVGYCHHKWLRSKEAFIITLAAMVNEEVKRAQRYMRGSLQQSPRYIEKCKKKYELDYFEYTILGGPIPSMEKLVEKHLYPIAWYGGMSVDEYLKEKPWEAKPLQETGECSEEYGLDEDLKHMKSNTSSSLLDLPF